MEVVAGADEAQGGEQVDHDKADAEVAEQVIKDTQDNNRDQMDTQADTNEMKQARGVGQRFEWRTRFSFSAGGARDDRRRALIGA